MVPADNRTFRTSVRGGERTSGYSPHRQGGAHSSARRRFFTLAQANLKTLGWRSCAMAKLVFGLNQSLDGYVDHRVMPPEPGLFRHFIDHVRGLTGMMYGRRMY